MKKQLIAFSVSAGLVISPMTAALASGPQQASMDDLMKLGQSALNKATGRTDVDLESTLQNVEFFKTQLQSLLATKEQDPFLRHMTMIKMALIAINTVGFKAHTSDSKISTAMLGISAASSLIDAAMTFYKKYQLSGKDVDMGELSKMIYAESQKIQEQMHSKGVTVPPEFLKITSDLNSISATIDQAHSDLAGLGYASEYTQMGAAVIGVGYFAFHLLSPKAASEADVVIGRFRDIFQKQMGQQAARRNGNAGNIASGATDFISVLVGSTSAQSQGMMSATAKNLETAANNLTALIADRSGKQ